MNILVTGGAGYIGSHVCVEFLAAGFGVVIYDHFCNSQKDVPHRVGKITSKNLTIIEHDVRDEDRLFNALRHDCIAVIHFAGLKAVG